MKMHGILKRPVCNGIFVDDWSLQSFGVDDRRQTQIELCIASACVLDLKTNRIETRDYQNGMYF